MGVIKKSLVVSAVTTAIVFAMLSPSPAAVSGELRVATFNISGANNDDKASGDQKIWSKRKWTVVNQIVAENTDVLGVQEAYQSTDTPQYTDLRNGLNSKGKPFEVTNTDPSASKATRILYNTATVEKTSQGSVRYSSQVSGKTDRYMVWAKFRQKSTGKKFFFANTHLSPDSNTVRKTQWKQLISKVKSLNTDNLKVIVVGDFNTSKYSSIAKDMLPAMKAAGFGDVMNQEFEVNPPRNPRAEHVVYGWINSFNDWRRDIRPYAYYKDHRKVGNGIDWVFATNTLRVLKWKVVINFDPYTLRINGTIPSDHNMISSIVVLR